jgi:membrane dipeptidase
MNGEQDPLLANQQNRNDEDYEEYRLSSHATLLRTSVWGVLTVLFVLGLVLVFCFEDRFAEWPWSGVLPKDPMLAAKRIMDIAPVIVR